MIISIFSLNWYFNDAGAADGDPHFMIELPERDDALCFNINDKPGTIFNLVRDAKSGQFWILCTRKECMFLECIKNRRTDCTTILLMFLKLGFVVNGQIIGKKKVLQDGIVNTYFGRLGISHKKLRVRLEVSTEDISVFHHGKHVRLLWSDTASIKETKWVTLWRYRKLLFKMKWMIRVGILSYQGRNAEKIFNLLFFLHNHIENKEKFNCHNVVVIPPQYTKNKLN